MNREWYGEVLSVGCYLVFTACSPAEPRSLDEPEPQTVFDESVQEPWGDGFWTCGVEKTVTFDGRESVMPRLYHFERMTARLRTDEVDGAAASSIGLTAIRSCDDALKFSRAQHSYREAKRLEALDEYLATGRVPDGVAVASPASDAPEEPAALVEKIMDGINWVDPGVVQIEIWNPSGASAGKCSGTLVNSYALLTAAHCIPVAGTGFMSVKHVSGTCLIGTCNGVRPAIRNAVFYPHPNYSGAGDRQNDIGVVRLSGRFWPAPANSSSVWYRFARSFTIVGSPFFAVGYGVMNQAGTGSGVERISSELDSEFNWFTSILDFVESGRGRPCKGDSGGPAIRNDTGPHDLVVGVWSGWTGEAGNCPDPSDDVHWGQTSVHADWIESQIMGGGSCNHFSQNGFAYARCF